LNITAMVSPARVKMRMVFLPYWCNVGIMHHTRSADRNRHVRRSAGATDMRRTLLGGFLDVLPATFDVVAGARNRIAPRRNGCNGEQDRKQNSVLHGFLLGKVGDVTRHAAAGLQYAGRSNHAPFPGKLPIGQAAGAPGAGRPPHTWTSRWYRMGHAQEITAWTRLWRQPNLGLAAA